jgi:hypothetical protein
MIFKLVFFTFVVAVIISQQLFAISLAEMTHNELQ